MVQIPDPASTAGSSFVSQPKSGCAQARCSSRTTRPSFYAPPKHWASVVNAANGVPQTISNAVTTISQPPTAAWSIRRSPSPDLPSYAFYVTFYRVRYNR